MRLKFINPQIKVITITDDDATNILGFTVIKPETGEEEVERDIAMLSGASASPSPGENWNSFSRVIFGLQELDEMVVGVYHCSRNFFLGRFRW